MLPVILVSVARHLRQNKNYIKIHVPESCSRIDVTDKSWRDVEAHATLNICLRDELKKKTKFPKTSGGKTMSSQVWRDRQTGSDVREWGKGFGYIDAPASKKNTDLFFQFFKISSYKIRNTQKSCWDIIEL